MLSTRRVAMVRRMFESVTVWRFRGEPARENAEPGTVPAAIGEEGAAAADVLDADSLADCVRWLAEPLDIARWFAAGAEAPLAIKASTSLRTIRPLGPVPSIWLRSTPLSAAIFLANGEANTRSCPEAAPLACGSGDAPLAGTSDAPALPGRSATAAALEDVRALPVALPPA